MLVNGHVAWNMSAKMNSIFRETIDNSSSKVNVSELMYYWKDSTVKNDIKILLPTDGPIADNNYDPIPMLY